MEASRIKQELVRRIVVCDCKIRNLRSPGIHEVGGSPPRRIRSSANSDEQIHRLEGERDGYKDLILMFGENPVRKIGKKQKLLLAFLKRRKSWPDGEHPVGWSYTTTARVVDTLVRRGFASVLTDGRFAINDHGREALDRAELRA